MRNIKNINNVSDYKYELDSHMALIIKNPKESDNFTCNVENIYGKDSRTFKVTVNGES